MMAYSVYLAALALVLIWPRPRAVSPG